MNNHYRLEILSGIAQDIIDSCTMRRAKLLAGKSKIPFFKKSYFKVALAAVLCLAIGLPLLWMLFTTGKQVPVYQGMTLSSEPPAVVEASPSPYRPIALYDSLTPQYALLAHKEQGFHDNRPGQKLTDAEGNPLSPEAGESIFYANQNEDFYITVHIDNPDNFEIVSFTLNGKKYSSYMFEDGSDMENLILKCNVGDASGIVEYTIDAIKYIDGTAIKDVRLAGDQTVKVGVYTDDQPTAMFGTLSLSFSEISFDLSINDPTGILGLLDSEVSVILYREDKAIDSKSVSIADATAVRFTGLDDGAEYRLAVIASYDAFDGAGKTQHTIGERTVTTPTIVTLQVSGISYTEAVAKLKWHNNVTDKTAVSFTLYKGSEKIRDLNGNEVKLTDLLSGTEYTLKVEYTQNGAVKSREVKFTTKTVNVPTLDISDLQPDLYSVCFKLNENDPLDLLTVNKIELKQGDAVVATANGTSTEFTDLELLQTYTIEVTYTYDLLNGSGTQTKVVKQRFGTQSKGLKIEGSMVTGIGTCTDTKIYVNMPIADHALENGMFTEVVLGNSVTSIGASAFAQCSGLKAINIPDGITTIDDHTFQDCAALEKVTLPDSLTAIGEEAFHSSGLKTIRLGAKITQIGAYAFANCYQLKEVNLPEGVTELLRGTFYQCKSLTEITLPDSLTELDAIVFYECEKLANIHLPKRMTAIGMECFRSTPIIEITIPDGITSLSSGLFMNCRQLTEVKLPDTLKKIDSWAFQSCYALKELQIPDDVEWIGYSAFWGCYGITMRLPTSVKTIEADVFYGDSLIITELASKPAGWHFDWAEETVTVVWNFKEFKTDSQGVTYALKNDGTAEVVGYNGNASIIRLEIEGYRTTRIARNAFHDNYAFNNAILIIPASVETMEANTFEADYSCKIYCEAPEKPAGWDDDWNSGKFTVIWGYTG